MQTYIKLTPHFLENLQKYWIYSHTFWIYSKKRDFIQKILVFSQTNDVYSAKIMILF